MNTRNRRTPSIEEMASRYTQPQPSVSDYCTPTHYLVYDVECGTVLIPREWYDGREREIEAFRTALAEAQEIDGESLQAAAEMWDRLTR